MNQKDSEAKGLDLRLSRRGLASVVAGAGTVGSLFAESVAAAEQKANPSSPVLVDRAFVRIREGLVHYRSGGRRPGKKAAPGEPLPLYMVHGGPGSSRGLEGMVRALGARRFVIAADTLGYGDSAPPDTTTVPDIPYFADSVARILDALEIEQIDFYGTHTGAHIGTELALRHPKRVRRLIFDGITFFTKEEREQYLANYAPHKEPDDYGSQFQWAWQFIRDMQLFFPHFAHDAAHRTPRGVPSAMAMHLSVVDVLKALTTYELPYNAVFRHELDKRLPLLTNAVLCMTYDEDPNLRYLQGGSSLIHNVRTAIIRRDQGPDVPARTVAEFLDS